MAEEFNILQPTGQPDGLVITKDPINTPPGTTPDTESGGPAQSTLGGYKKPPTFLETAGASFRLENEVVGAVRALQQQRDFGEEDPEHNAWDAIKGTKYEPYYKAFATSRNGTETEFLRGKIEEELEDRRIREASGGFTSFMTDMAASLLSPTNIGPLALAGRIYKGYGVANAARSAASVGTAAAGGAAIQEAALHAQQYTRTWQESMFAVGGATVLGGLLGAGISEYGSRALARASRQLDADLARIKVETEAIGAREPRGDAQAVGAAPARVVQENVIEGAYGVEKAFEKTNPLTRVLASELRAARDVITRLAEMPFRLRQNREGIATGPAGGSAETRIKIDAELATYRMAEALQKEFAAYRFGNADAKFAKTRASFADMAKLQQGRLGFKEFKAEVTSALRSQSDRGIEHAIPEVKRVAEAVRKEVFEPFKKEAQKLGLFPEDAEFSMNYVMRKYDINAILNDYARFKQILVDHLKGGQARARAELAAVEREIAASRTEGDMTGEVDALSRQFEAERARVMEARSAQANVKSSIDEDAAYLDELTKAIRVAELDMSDAARMARAEAMGFDTSRVLYHGTKAAEFDAFRPSEKGKFGAGVYLAPDAKFAKEWSGDDGRVIEVFVRGRMADDAAWKAAMDAEYEANPARSIFEVEVAAGERLQREGFAGVTSKSRNETVVYDPSNIRSTQAAFNPQQAASAKLMDDPVVRILSSELLDVETRMADEKAAGKKGDIDGGDEPLFAGKPLSEIKRIVESGQNYHVADADIERQFDAALDFVDALPAGSRLGVWASIGPGSKPGEARSVIRTLAGDIGFTADLDAMLASRAFYHPHFDLIVPGSISRDGASGEVASGIYHEIVHAYWRRLGDPEKIALVAHADGLGVMEMKFADFLKKIGDPTWIYATPGETLRMRYNEMYAGRSNIQDLLKQEAVAHMQELHYAGHLSDAQVAPVLKDLMNMRGGAVRGAADDTSGSGPVFAAGADRATGQSMRRDLDALGYYSQALEAAKTFQNKGTPEQALAWLKKSGVKDAEIEATGLKAFLEGKASVTKDELVGHMEGNRVGLTESKYGGFKPYIEEEDGAFYVLADNGDPLFEARSRSEAETWISQNQDLDYMRDHTRAGKWAPYSLDPSNPTYRETVLHLPPPKRSFETVVAALQETGVLDRNPTAGHMQAWRDAYEAGTLESDAGSTANLGTFIEGRDFQSGHFPEPNIIGHMMTSMTTHKGKPVYTIDQIQSDWGQRLRDRGARDEEKIADLKRQLAAIPGSDKPFTLQYRDKEAFEKVRLLTAELKTAEAATSGNPLVNTTDQWVNTTLRRAIRQAAEADAEYIAIPSGDTVLKYNPGDTDGMRGFYGSAAYDLQKAEALRVELTEVGQGPRYVEIATRLREMDRLGNKGQVGIVPKNLRNLLQKIDKDIKPEHIETLDSPSGKSGLGQGFTLFPLTDKVKRSVMEEGQPLFAAGGDAAPPPKVELDPAIIKGATELASRLGIQMPDLAGLDIDGIVSAVSKAIGDMTGVAKQTAKGSAADVQKLMSKADELRYIADASDAELAAIAGDTISKITGSPAARNINPYDPVFSHGKAGPLQARTLKIPDDKIVDFLDDDIERIVSGYVRGMAPDIALTKEFGDLNLTEDLRRIEDEAQQMIAANPERAREIRQQANKNMADIQAITARLRGTYNHVPDPTAWGPRAASIAKQSNVLRLMGAVVAASISDVPKLLFVHGFRQNADLFSTLATNLAGVKMAKAEAKELSAGLEMVMSRGGQMWDAFDDFVGHTVPERALRVATNKYGRLTLMDQWNSTWKQLSGIMTMNRVLRHSVDSVAGRISPRDLAKLAASGIDEEIAQRIAAQYAQHGTVHGRLFLANANDWDDILAKQALQAAVRREADLTVVTPGQEKPLWTSSHLGSVIGQFRTFQLVTVQRTLIAGLQEMDAAKVSAMAMMIGLGMLSEQLKMVIHGKENKNPPKDFGDWMYVGLSNSGLLGWISDADQIADKMTGGTASVGRLAFGHERPTSRFASQNIAGALLGPSFGAAQDVLTANRAAWTREFKEGDVHALRRLLPYQNLFYISRVLREFEEGFIDAAGVKRSQPRN